MHFVRGDHFTLTYIKMVKNIRNPYKNRTLSHGLAAKSLLLFCLPVSPKLHTKSLNVSDTISSKTRLTTISNRFITQSVLAFQQWRSVISILRMFLNVPTKHFTKPKLMSAIKSFVATRQHHIHKFNYFKRQTQCFGFAWSRWRSPSIFSTKTKLNNNNKYHEPSLPHPTICHASTCDGYSQIW